MNQHPRGRALPGIFLWAGVVLGVFVSGCSIPEVRTADRLAAGGHWDAAVAAYRVAVRKEPFNDDLRLALEAARSKASEQHYTQGHQALKEDRLPEALQELNLALSLDPTRPEFHDALAEALRLKDAREKLQAGDKLRGLGRLDEALQAYEQAVELDPSLVAALQAITLLTQQQRADKSLGHTGQPITLRFQNARLKEVFEILARAGGINVVFDKDFKDDMVSIFIKDTPFPDALSMILSSNNLFSRRVGPDTLLIIPNTKQKQDQFQDQMIRTFYLSNARAKDMVNALRTMLDSKRVYVNEQINSIVIRDQPDKLRLAERIIQANDRRDSEVEFEVEVLEVDRTMSEKLGLNYAKAAGLAALPTPAGSAAVAFGSAFQFTYQQLTSIGPSVYAFSVPTSALLDFFRSESQAKVLANPKIRVANGKKGFINVGDKQPILLSTTNVLPGQAATGAVPTTSTVTSIEFKDVGIKVTIEPIVHLVNEVTLKLTIDVTRLGEKVTLQESPLIQQFRFGTRTAETTLNLKDMETVVLAGLIQDDQRVTRTGVPYLMDIPWLGKFFTQVTTDTVSTELILTLTPKVVRNVTLPDIEHQAFWSGTEANYATVPLFTDTSRGSPKKMSFKVDPVPASPVAPSVGSLGQVPPASVDKPAAAPGLADSSSTTLALLPARLTAFVGQEFTVDLVAQHMDSPTATTITLTYDPHMLEFQRVVDGALLNPDGASQRARVTAMRGAGEIELRLGQQDQPVTGSGVLSTLLFKAKSTGKGPVQIQMPTVSTGEAKTPQVVVAHGEILVR